jgi:hypothetical protein
VKTNTDRRVVRVKAIFLLIGLGSALAACATTRPNEETAVSLCSLDMNSAMPVVIQAKFVTDRFHEPHFVDTKCPGKIFIAHITDESEEVREIDELGWAIFTGPGLAEFYIRGHGQVVIEGGRQIFRMDQIYQAYRLK